MKKFLTIIGGISVVLLLILASFIGFIAYQSHGLDASSKAYVEESIPAITSTWSKDEMLKRSSPILLRTVNEKPDQTEKLFEKLSALGPLLSFDNVKGASNTSYSTKLGKVTTAAYAVNAKFKNGEGHINIRLIRTPDGQWQLLQFYVNSPFFLQ